MKYIGIFVVAVLVLFGAIYLPRRTTVPITSTSTPIYTTPTTTPPTSTPTGTLSYGDVTLAIGETAHFAGLMLTPQSVVEDSRCPMGVQCIQAGTVRVQTQVVTTATSTQTIGLGKSIIVKGITIALTNVLPPKPQGGVATSSYRFTFSVTKPSPAATTTEPVATGGCYVGGCSGEVCSDQQGVASNCIYTPSYACYKSARCERQASGQCGWTATPEYQMCLATTQDHSSIQ